MMQNNAKQHKTTQNKLNTTLQLLTCGYFGDLCRIWRERLRPELVLTRLGEGFQNHEPPPEIQKSVDFEEAKTSHFSGLTIAENTLALWGR